MDMSAFRAVTLMNPSESPPVVAAGIRPLLGQKPLSLAKVSLRCEQPVFRMRSLKAVRIDQVWPRWNQVPKINCIREECRLLQTFMIKSILNAQSLFGLKDVSASSFCQLFSLRIQEKERKEERAFRMQGDKAVLSFIYRDELGTGASHNWGPPFCERALESQEKGIAKSNSIFREITIIKPFLYLLRGKDNNHKCSGDIKTDFVKSHF